MPILCQALCPTVPTHYLLGVSGNRCHDARCITQVKVQESEVTPQVRQLVSERGRIPPKSAQLFLLTLCLGNEAIHMVLLSTHPIESEFHFLPLLYNLFEI